MKPAIPSPAGSEDERILRPMKEILDRLTGARIGRLEELPSTATSADIIDKINAVIRRLNANGE